MKALDDSKLQSMGVAVMGHRKRILGMLEGRDDISAQFAFASPAQVEVH